ncbi:MAG: hypothetical protein WBA17_02805 [Saprospiraceae bacterium]
MEETKKRTISPFMWVVLVLCGLLLLTFILKAAGVNVAGTQEESEIIQHPHRD